MTSNDILRSDLLDILFDNRNKQYGAYTLRKHYNNRLTFSLLTAIGLALLLFFIFRGNGNDSTNNFFGKPEEVVIRQFSIPNEKERIPDQPKQKAASSQPVKQQQFTKFIIQPDKVVQTPAPDQNLLMTGMIGKQTLDGRLPSIGDLPAIKDPVDNGGGNVEAEKHNAFVPNEREPEFPGGTEAWLGFLRKNLSAPDQLEAGEKKSVMVRFLVSVDGSVTGFEIVQSAGRNFDNEVIRVLKKMPRWKPAIQNGVPVVKYYTQPVTFIGVEQ